FAHVVFAAMQSVVKAFGYFKKVIATSDDLPFGCNLKFIHERDEPVQYFGDAAAHRGGVDHFDGFSTQLARHEAELINIRAAQNGLVIFQLRRWSWSRRGFAHLILAALARRRNRWAGAAPLAVSFIGRKLRGLGGSHRRFFLAQQRRVFTRLVLV